METFFYQYNPRAISLWQSIFVFRIIFKYLQYIQWTRAVTKFKISLKMSKEKKNILSKKFNDKRSLLCNIFKFLIFTSVKPKLYHNWLVGLWFWEARFYFLEFCTYHLIKEKRERIKEIVLTYQNNLLKLVYWIQEYQQNFQKK